MGQQPCCWVCWWQQQAFYTGIVRPAAAAAATAAAAESVGQKQLQQQPVHSQTPLVAKHPQLLAVLYK
jgi:hypothetical protein